MSTSTTTSTAPTSPTPPKRDPAPAGAKVETALAKSIRLRYREGKISCKNEDHFYLANAPAGGDGHRVVARLAWRTLLARMAPYQEAACSCERDCLTEASNHNYFGMPQTLYVAFGALQMGVGKYSKDQPAKRVAMLGYRLTTDEFTYLSGAYPEWFFVTDTSDGHDHAIAHTVTRIAAYDQQRKLPKGTSSNPYRVLDLYGNPGSNEAFNRRSDKTRIDTSVFVSSAKDCVRVATKWGREFDSAGVRRYFNADLRSMDGTQSIEGHPNISDYDRIIAVHCMYYFTPTDICSLVNKMAPSACLEVLCHRFDGAEKGTINAGEQQWEKYDDMFSATGDVRGMRKVRQTNVRTGEDYNHFDNSWLFESTLWHNVSEDSTVLDGKPVAASTDKCMTWTINKASEDTYRITFVKLPPVTFNLEVGYGSRLTAGPYLTAATPQKKKRANNKKKAIKETGGASIKVGDTVLEVVVPPTCQQLFDEARIRMRGRARTPAQMKDHNAWVKVQIKGVMAKHKDIGADDVGDLVHGSFWIDFVEDCGLMTTGGAQRYIDSIKSDRLFKEGDMGTYHDLFDKVLGLAHDLVSAKDTRAGVKTVISSIRLFGRKAT